MIKVSTTGMAVSLKTDLRFPESGQHGHGSRIIHLIDEPELSMHPIWQKRFCPIIAIFSPPKQNR